jgi:N-acetylglutamate synthase
MHGVKIDQMAITYRELTLSDYDAVIALWQSADGVGLSDADSREAIGRYLARNPGMSFTRGKAIL